MGHSVADDLPNVQKQACPEIINQVSYLITQ